MAVGCSTDRVLAAPPLLAVPLAATVALVPTADVSCLLCWATFAVSAASICDLPPLAAARIAVAPLLFACAAAANPCLLCFLSTAVDAAEKLCLLKAARKAAIWEEDNDALGIIVAVAEERSDEIPLLGMCCHAAAAPAEAEVLAEAC